MVDGRLAAAYVREGTFRDEVGRASVGSVTRQCWACCGERIAAAASRRRRRREVKAERRDATTANKTCQSTESAGLDGGRD